MSGGLVALLGDKLLGGSGEVSTGDALTGKGAVALYFSAHSSQPCREFTPQFVQWYKHGLRDKGLEVVLVSSDGDLDSYKEHFSEMPWMGLPYDDRERKDRLSRQFRVQAIPTVVILDSDGNVITMDGRAAIIADPTGEEFPWKPKSLKDILACVKLINNEGLVESNVLDGQVFGLYFSAHFAPPCRVFTPQLAEWYNKDLKNKGLEIVFVSSDENEATFTEYFKDQPWLALDFSERKAKDELSNLFGVRGIPSLVIIDRDGTTITKNAQTAVKCDPEGIEFPWYPKPLQDVASGAGLFNEMPVLVALCESASLEAQQRVQDAIEPLARKFIAEAKAGEEPKVSFLMAKGSDGIATHLRRLMSLEAVPPPKHQHPLKEADVDDGDWVCDCCERPGETCFKRFICTMGCDFDYCEQCNSRVESGRSLPCKVVLINVPDGGAFYVGPDGDITAESVETFVDDFMSGSAVRRELLR